jgi:hypothetical protein
MARDYGITNAAPWASAPAVGAAGATYWNTTQKMLYVSDGGAWQSAIADAPNGVTTAKLNDGQITTAKLATDSVDGTKLTSPYAARVARLGGGSNAVGFTVITWTNAESYGFSAQLWSAATPDRFTIPKAGFYAVGGAAEFAAIASGTRILLVIRGNGATEYARAEIPIIASTPDTRALAVSAGALFNLNDYVQLLVWHNASSALAFSGTNPTFWIMRIG